MHAARIVVESVCKINIQTNKEHNKWAINLFQGIIIIILAFLQQRRTYKKEVWGGRPGIVVYVNRPDNRGVSLVADKGRAQGEWSPFLMQQKGTLCTLS